MLLLQACRLTNKYCVGGIIWWQWALELSLLISSEFFCVTLSWCIFFWNQFCGRILFPFRSRNKQQLLVDFSFSWLHSSSVCLFFCCRFLTSTDFPVSVIWNGYSWFYCRGYKLYFCCLKPSWKNFLDVLTEGPTMGSSTLRVKWCNFWALCPISNQFSCWAWNTITCWQHHVKCSTIV